MVPGESQTDPGTPGSEPDTDPWESQEQLRRLRRRRRWWYAIAVTVGLLVVAVVGANFVPLPYTVVSPGSVRSTEGLVRVEGRPTYSDDGSIGYTTVSVGDATAWSALVGWLDPTRDVYPVEDYRGNQSRDENRELNLRLMDQSKQTAEVVALRQLGYDVEAAGTGAVIAEVVEGSAADGQLQQGDTIVGVDGEPVGTADELVAMLAGHAPGDVVTLTVEDQPDDPDPQEVEVTLGAREDDPDAPFLGVATGTRDIDFTLPFIVSIDSGDVGGPSAGLAFTLGIIDVLTPGSLTGGNHVAVTGTIGLDGSVGRIGGMHQKVETVKREGATVFIVPNADLAEAQQYADGLTVIGVDDLDDALEELGRLGGDVEMALGPPEGS